MPRAPTECKTKAIDETSMAFVCDCRKTEGFSTEKGRESRESLTATAPARSFKAGACPSLKQDFIKKYFFNKLKQKPLTFCQWLLSLYMLYVHFRIAAVYFQYDRIAPHVF